jgi:hypothetical protein
MVLRSDRYVANVVAARIADPDLLVVDAHFIGAVDMHVDRRIRMVITVLEGQANLKKVVKRRTLSFSCTPEIARSMAASLIEAADRPPDDEGWIPIDGDYGPDPPDLDDDHRFEREREERWPDS